MINWLYHTSLDLILLIGLVLLIRPLIKHFLGAHISYWLWLIPLTRIFFIDKPTQPALIAETIKLPNGNFILNLAPPANTWVIPDYLNLQLIWISGICTWVTIRTLSWLLLQQRLGKTSSLTELSTNLKRIKGVRS